EVQGRRDDLAQVLHPVDLWHPQVDRDGGGRKHQVGGRQQATGPPGVEPDQSDAAGGRRLTGEVGRDEETGDDEEDVDAHEAAGDASGPQMVEDDKESGACTQSLDLRTYGCRGATLPALSV